MKKSKLIIIILFIIICLGVYLGNGKLIYSYRYTKYEEPIPVGTGNDSSKVVFVSKSNLDNNPSINVTYEVTETKDSSLVYGLVGKNINGEIIWYENIKEVPIIGTENDTYIKVVGESVYFAYDGKLEKRNLQTGKVIWSTTLSSLKFDGIAITETNGKVVVAHDFFGRSLDILDSNTGVFVKKIYSIDNAISTFYSSYSSTKYYDIVPETIEADGNIVRFEVRNYSSNGLAVGKVGYLYVDIESSKVNFNKKF